MYLALISLIVQNYQNATAEDIGELLTYISEMKKQELGFDFSFKTTMDEGGAVLNERTPDGKIQVEIGLSDLYDIDEEKYLGIEYDKDKKRMPLSKQY